MASHKRSAQKRQRASFESSFGQMDGVFRKEEQRRETEDAQREAALRSKACTSKNRYATRAEAMGAIAACEEYGTRGLHCYRCSYCKGWHLTSHPR